MALLDIIRERAAKSPQRVAFPEAQDESMMRAAAQAVREGFCEALLVGDVEALRDLAAERGLSEDLFTFVSNTDEEAVAVLAARYAAIPGTMLGEKAIARRCKADPLYMAVTMEAVGDADVTFAGILATTGEVIMAGQMVIGLAEGIDVVSSVGIVDVAGFEGSEGTLLAFGDSAVCVNPSAPELASIAISCCETVRDLLGWEPRCALVSHSTCGSAVNELTEKVTTALAIAQERRPDLDIDGEFQLDAALLTRVAERKVGRPSRVAGRANVVVWPDLNVGNTAVKAMQIMGHAGGAGPFLQGFAKIVSDCSRGASVEELVGNVAVSVVRAAALKGDE